VHDELAGDAWLVGRVTGQEFAKGKPYPASTHETFPREPWFASRDAQAYGVVLDAHGKIAWGRSGIGGDPIVVVLSQTVSDAHLAGLRGEGVSSFFAGKSELDLALVLDILNRELGVKRLLLERRGRIQRRFPASGPRRRAHPHPLSGGGRRERGAERLRLSGNGNRPACACHGNGAGKQSRFGRRSDASALSDPERGCGNLSGPITAIWLDLIVVSSSGPHFSDSGACCREAAPFSR
jgi:hypothetical protein